MAFFGHKISGTLLKELKDIDNLYNYDKLTIQKYLRKKKLKQFSNEKIEFDDIDKKLNKFDIELVEEYYKKCIKFESLTITITDR